MQPPPFEPDLDLIEWDIDGRPLDPAKRHPLWHRFKQVLRKLFKR